MRTLALLLALTVVLAPLSAAPTPQVLPTGSSPKSVAFSADGSLAYVTNLEACTVSVYDSTTLQKVRTILFPKTPATGWSYTGRCDIPSVAEKPVQTLFTHGGRYLWVSLHNASAVAVFAVEGRGFDPRQHPDTLEATVREADGRVWWRSMLRIPTGRTPKVLALSPDGKVVACSDWHGRSVTLIGTTTFETLGTLSLKAIPRGLAFAPDGRRLYVGIIGADRIEVFDSGTWKRTAAIAGVGKGPRELVIDRAGAFLYATCERDGTVAKVDLALNKPVATCKVGAHPRTLAFSPAQKRLYVCCYGERKLYVIKVSTFEVTTTVATGANPVGVAVAPTGDVWVTNQGDDTVTVYQVPRVHAATEGEGRPLVRPPSGVRLAP